MLDEIQRCFIAGLRAQTKLASTTALVLTLATPQAAADSYMFAGGNTQTTVSWSHAGLSRHDARITGAKGTLEFDPVNPTAAKVEVRINIAAISSGVPALDRLLRGPDYFDATAHPTMTFRSTEVRPTGERTGDVVGELTIKGRTRPVTLQVTWNFSGEHPLGLLNPSYTGRFVSGFSATANLRRSDWGLERGAPLISDEVRLVIETEVFRK